MSTPSSYNGWCNYETWDVNLWLNQNEQSCRILMDAVRLPFMQDWERGEWLRDMLSYQLTDEVDEPSIWQDLLRHAFNKVDWVEIIQSNCE